MVHEVTQVVVDTGDDVMITIEVDLSYNRIKEMGVSEVYDLMFDYVNASIVEANSMVILRDEE